MKNSNMNTLKKRTVNKRALVASVFALALLLASKVSASGPFATSYNNASLTGVYGYSAVGWLLGSSTNGSKDPLDVCGVMWFDGGGTLSFMTLRCERLRRSTWDR